MFSILKETELDPFSQQSINATLKPLISDQTEPNFAKVQIDLNGKFDYQIILKMISKVSFRLVRVL